MIRIRIAAFAALAAALSCGAIACGEDDADAFKEEYNAAVKPLLRGQLRRLRRDQRREGLSNAVIAKDFQGLAQKTQQTKDNLTALDPPEDAKDAYDDLLSALKKGTQTCARWPRRPRTRIPWRPERRATRSNPPPRTSRRRSRGCGGLWTGSDLGAHRREQHDLPDRAPAAEEHHQAVDADAHAPPWAASRARSART